MQKVNTMKNATLADRIRAARTAKGLTQEKLAELAQSTQAVIQKIENGKSLRPRKIEQLASVLGVTPGYLMFGESMETKPSIRLSELRPDHPIVKAAHAMVKAHVAHETALPALNKVNESFPSIEDDHLIILWVAINAKSRSLEGGLNDL